MLFKNIKNKKGITLLEVIIVLALISIVMLAFSSMFNFGNKTYAKGNSQYDIQSDVRIVSDYVQREVRYSTYAEITSKGAMNAYINDYENDNVDEEYSFVYFDPENKRLVHLNPDPDNENQYTTKMALGITIESLTFRKDKEDTVTMIVAGVKMDSSNNIEQKYELKNELLFPNLHIDELDVEDDFTVPDETYYSNVLKFSEDINLLSFSVGDDVSGGGDETGGGDSDPAEPTDEQPSGGQKSFTITFNKNINIGTISINPEPTNYSIDEEDGDSTNNFTMESNNFSTGQIYTITLKDKDDLDVTLYIKQNKDKSVYTWEFTSAP